MKKSAPTTAIHSGTIDTSRLVSGAREDVGTGFDRYRVMVRRPHKIMHLSGRDDETHQPLQARPPPPRPCLRAGSSRGPPLRSPHRRQGIRRDVAARGHRGKRSNGGDSGATEADSAPGA